MAIVEPTISPTADGLSIKGELTFVTVEGLLTVSLPLLQTKANELSESLQIDLSAVSHIDSAGLALLCEWKRRAPQVSFHQIPHKVDKMITLSGLAPLFALT